VPIRGRARIAFGKVLGTGLYKLQAFRFVWARYWESNNRHARKKCSKTGDGQLGRGLSPDCLDIKLHYSLPCFRRLRFEI
jgi:hypothetical protein